MYNSHYSIDDAAGGRDCHSDSDFADQKLLSVLDGQRWTPRGGSENIGSAAQWRGQSMGVAVGKEASTKYAKRWDNRNKANQDINRSIKDSSNRSKRGRSLFPRFEYHYDFFTSDNLLGNLKTIHKGLGTRSYIHDWDEKLNLVKSLVLYAIHEFEHWGLDNGGHIIASSAIDNVVTVNGTVCRQRAHPGDLDTKGHSFSHGVHEPLPAPIDETTMMPRVNYGRVV